MPILLFFVRVIWAWELKLNFQRYFVVCVMKMKMKMKMKMLQVIALFYDLSLTDYPLFQTCRLNIFSILFFQAFSTPWFLFSNATNHHLVFFLLEIFNNIIQYQFDGMTLSIISWIAYQFLCMSSWRTDTLMMFVVCGRDLSFLPLHLGGMQVNDLNNSWLSRQTYILLQMSEEIVLFFREMWFEKLWIFVQTFSWAFTETSQEQRTKFAHFTCIVFVQYCPINFGKNIWKKS